MANMAKNATTGKYELEITPSTSAQTKTIKVGAKYCDCDIDVKVSAVATASWGTSASGTLQKTVTPSGSVQYVNITAGYTDAKYIQINAKSISYSRTNVYVLTGSCTMRYSTRTGSSGTFNGSAKEAYYVDSGSIYKKTASGTTFSAMSGYTNIASIQVSSGSNYTSFSMIIGAS